MKSSDANKQPNNKQNGDLKEEKKRHFIFAPQDNRAKHATEVASYLVDRQAEAKKSEILEACNKVSGAREIKPDEFWKKYEILCKRWVGRYTSLVGDTRGRRFANEILRTVASAPTTVAAIDDNLTIFKSAEEKARQDGDVQPNVWIEVSCFVGAKSIFEYVQKKYNVNVAKLEEALPFAISSGNKELALEVAGFSKKQDAKEPMGIYLYIFENSEVAQAVHNEFSKTLSPVT